MTGSVLHESAHLRIVGAETAGNTVSVDVLVRILQGLQQTAILLEASTEQRPVEGRFRPSEGLRRRCELRCGPLNPGSVAVSLSISAEESLLPGESKLGRLLDFIHAVANGDQQAMNRIVPDSRFRGRALRETLGYLPRSGQRWFLEIGNGATAPTRLTTQTRRTVEDWFLQATEAQMVLTGQLVRIDFEKNHVDIRYPVTNKLLRCNYEVDSEDLLIQNRRGWVQARGVFELDDAGNPVDALDVTQIDPLDLSPMVFDRVTRDGRALIIDPPLALNPVLDKESSQLLTVEFPDLGLCTYAPTRESLEDEVVLQLFFLWKEYALEKPTKLSPSAKRLQQALKNQMREDSHAP